MDAKIIYETFRSRPIPLAILQDGPILTDIQIKKLLPGGMQVMGSYMPHRNRIVKILLDRLCVEAVVRARNDVQCSIAFLRPVLSDNPY
ncbi:hypothetical protein MOK15_21015 [Sphingobium sp. BYY-5]|uniref:hypothetical protein n=1 Tax=Sphingobium sp. BYY-5 TaxID=2926400 RepID=UPI001FA6D696|nr:hypothetical protein [Sphingobium sp. BYY-5]MCI4592543.1 hypothetical protein [Sphingobium sp. BYY-5]